MHARKLRDQGWVVTETRTAEPDTGDGKVRLVVRIMAALEIPTLEMSMSIADQTLPMSWVLSEVVRYVQGIGVDEDTMTRLDVYNDNEGLDDSEIKSIVAEDEEKKVCCTTTSATTTIATTTYRRRHYSRRHLPPYHHLPPPATCHRLPPTTHLPPPPGRYQ